MQILLFGDSIMNCGHLKKKYRWPHLLKKKIKKIKKNFFVTSKGVNGATSSFALSYLDDKILIRKKNIVIFQFGINDSWHFKSLRGLANVEKKIFRSNLEKIIAKCKKFKIKKIYFLTYHLVSKKRVEANKKTINQNIKKYNSIIRSVVRKNKNVNLIDIESLTRDIPSSIICMPKPDEVHLSRFGSMLYFNIVFLKIFELVN